MQKITPFFWFDGIAEDAAKFYTALFPNSSITTVSKYPEGTPMSAGSTMTVEFSLNGQDFVGLNAGSGYTFSPATSFVIYCESQEEVDHYWSAFLEGGKPMACGWITDKFGITWQVTPTILMKYMCDPDLAKASRVARAMGEMVKIDIAAIQKAYEG